MNAKYHIQITREALSEFFSERAMRTITRANIGQDRIKNQIGHDHYHFDSNAFEAGFAYIDQQKRISMDAIEQGNYQAALAAFGRLLHTWQDYYSHSNYVRLWAEIHPSASHSEITPDDETVFKPSRPAFRNGLWNT